MNDDNQSDGDPQLPIAEPAGEPAPEATPPPAPATRPRSFGAHLRAYFFAGLLVTLPLTLTIYLAWKFVTFVDRTITPLIPVRFNPETYLPFAVPGLGLAVLIVALIVIGALAAGYVGRLLVRTFEHMLAQMPVIRSVYSALKQITETILTPQSGAFRQAVLIEYPRRGLWAIGFLTGITSGEVQYLTDDEVLNVFLPTTPNPTSGFLLFVPRGDVTILSMSVEDALKMVISGGIVTPAMLDTEESDKPQSADK